MKNKFSFITANPLLKLISFTLAVALWFFVVSKGRSGIIMDVPLGFKNLPPGLELVETAKTVSLTIEGQERLLKNLKQDNISVAIDLKNAKKGETSFLIAGDDIRLPQSIVVTKISPQKVKLMLEEKLKKSVPVKPVITGLPAEGFAVKKIEVEPKTVEIEGPVNSVTKIYSVRTEPVDISDVTEDFHFTANLNITRKNVRADVSEVKVNIYVRRIR
ncbi:MAG: YbbR-like domain-containing protein [Nitrospirae bacterium]|nr:YbbR-like domain-containing protein [Nitrospirota bacterium]MBI4839451.1 YbbR-like domain-containing protein [Nitrospirota bacterium]